MSEDEKEHLKALKILLDMTDMEDWYLFHHTVRQKVLKGELSKEFEKSYKALVDKMADEREGEKNGYWLAYGMEKDC